MKLAFSLIVGGNFLVWLASIIENEIPALGMIITGLTLIFFGWRMRRYYVWPWQSITTEKQD